ncbi:aldolase/citrate lyase family protein [Paraburkholderia sp. JHI2823]|uniref:HpcH/HpaI aldolase family protein n=1 Tax=Paraburkholderia sp. JHI2823 TaxID=3112960 RepID=UPI00316E6A53
MLKINEDYPMLFTSLKSRLDSPNSVDLIWLALGSVAMAEFAAHARPGAVVLDLQHGLWDRASMESAIAVIGKQVPVIARCAANGAHEIAQALDAGAASILVPLVETADDARRAVEYARYPPLGKRSAGGVRPLLHGMETMIESGLQVAVGVLIETVTGIENADAIAAVPGIDYLFIGTGDLSLSRGTADPHTIGRDCDRVRAAARAHGLPCGIYTRDAEATREAFAQGYRMAVAANDIDLIKQGFRVAHDAALK